MTDSIATRLERTSRVSALLMALSAVLILGALLLSYKQLQSSRTEVELLQVEATKLRAENGQLSQQDEEMRSDVKGLRVALTASRDAIAAFQQHDYTTAVGLYDEALRADPNDAYLLNLKAYSLFKLNNLKEAIAIQSESVRVDPSYAWGYFDLARFQCAAGQFDEAKKSIETMLNKDSSMTSTINRDGEFKRLCGSILK